jgi:dienelactone hydrolase
VVPGTGRRQYPVAPWLTQDEETTAEQLNGLPADLLRWPATHGHFGAPVGRQPGGHPVVLFSHDSGGGHKSSTTMLAEELASRGYVVVTMAHPYDAELVQLPDGRIVVRQERPDTVAMHTKEVGVRAGDVRFVLDSLDEVKQGRNPDAERRTLPRDLAGALDLSAVGMYGNGMGGATTAAAMHADRRIKAGVTLDGTLYGPVVHDGLDRPLLFMGSQNHDGDASWASLWSRLRGWRLHLKLAGSGPASFTDDEALVSQGGSAIGLTPAAIEDLIGTIDPDRAVAAERAYLCAFFDLHLRHRGSPLLRGPSPRYPEVQFIEAMTPRERAEDRTRQLTQRFQQAFEQRNLAAVGELLAPNASLVYPFTSYPDNQPETRYSGGEQVLA